MFGPAWLGVVGLVFEIANIAFDPRVHFAPQILARNGENGTSILSEALSKCLPANNSLTSSLDELLQRPDFTNDMRITLSYRAFHDYFVSDPSTWGKCRDMELFAGIKLEQFAQIGKFYHQISELDDALGGLVEESALVNALEASCNSTDADKHYVNDIGRILEVYVDAASSKNESFERLELFVKTSDKLLQDDNIKNNLRILKLNNWGTVGELFHVHALYAYQGWHWLNVSENSTCSQSLEPLQPNDANSTDLLDVLEVAADVRLRFAAQFLPFLDLVRRRLDEHHASPTRSTDAQTMVSVCRTLTGFAEPGRGRLEEVLNLPLYADRSVGAWCACAGVRPPPRLADASPRLRLDNNQHSRKRRWPSLWPFF